MFEFLIYAVSGKAAVSWCFAKVGHGFFVYCLGKGRGLAEGMEGEIGKSRVSCAR